MELWREDYGVTLVNLDVQAVGEQPAKNDLHRDYLM